MSLDNTTPKRERAMKPEEETQLIKLLESGQFEPARKYADHLLGQGVLRAIVNHTSYPIVKRYIGGYYQNGRTAEELAMTFKDYSWSFWLPKERKL